MLVPKHRLRLVNNTYNRFALFSSYRATAVKSSPLTRGCLSLMQPFQIWQISGLNSGVSFSNNWIVASRRWQSRILIYGSGWWAFQVSRRSIETLFRWGGNCLRYFAANVFSKRCIKFHQNRQSFVRDITKKTLWFHFLFTWFYSKFIQKAAYQISPQSLEFYRRYYKKNFLILQLPPRGMIL